MSSFRQMCHLGPLTAIGIMKVITGATVYCNSKWWPPADSIGGALNSLLFFVFSSMAAVNFFTVIFDGPGFLPRRWHPADNDTRYLQYCEFCLGFKAPRSHHCKKCHRCVLKMDHHCPWINGCIGYQNHGHFILFIFFTVCGCLQSVIVLSSTLQAALSRGWYYRHFHNIDYGYSGLDLGLPAIAFAVFALGISIGIVVAVGILLFFQLRSLLRNRTAVEEWIVENAVNRRTAARIRGENVEPFVFPYSLGMWENVKQVLNWEMKPKGDGIIWKIRSHPSCDQYSLTREQMEQKLHRRQRAKIYTAIKEYSGTFFPISLGLPVLFNLPLTDEYRLPLSLGDNIRVTKCKRYWLFGEKQNQEENDGTTKGWFPRSCVIEISGGTGDIANGGQRNDL